MCLPKMNCSALKLYLEFVFYWFTKAKKESGQIFKQTWTVYNIIHALNMKFGSPSSYSVWDLGVHTDKRTVDNTL